MSVGIPSGSQYFVPDFRFRFRFGTNDDLGGIGEEQGVWLDDIVCSSMAPAAIPALREWGLLAVMASLLLTTIAILGRRFAA